MLSGGKRTSRGEVAGHRRVSGRVFAVVLSAALLLTALLSAVGSGSARALPDVEPNLVTTLRCGTTNPWPAPPLRVSVDVYNQIAFPADGLPGPAIALIGSSRTQQGPVEYTTEVRVNWRNLRTGRQGVVTVPSRARTVTWRVDLHPGAGPVAFTIRQKVGAMAFVPMVNPQFSSCSGRATA